MKKYIYITAVSPLLISCSSAPFYDALYNNHDVESVKKQKGIFTNVNNLDPIRNLKPIRMVKRPEVLEFLLDEGGVFQNEDYEYFIHKNLFECAKLLKSRGATLSPIQVHSLLQEAFHDRDQQRFDFVLKNTSLEKENVLNMLKLCIREKRLTPQNKSELEAILNNKFSPRNLSNRNEENGKEDMNLKEGLCFFEALIKKYPLSSKEKEELLRLAIDRPVPDVSDFLWKIGANIETDEKYSLVKNFLDINDKTRLQLLASHLRDLNSLQKSELLYSSLSSSNIDIAETIQNSGGELNNRQKISLLALSLSRSCEPQVFNFVMEMKPDLETSLQESISQYSPRLLKRIEKLPIKPQSLLEFALIFGKTSEAKVLDQYDEQVNEENLKELFLYFVKDSITIKEEEIKFLCEKFKGEKIINLKNGLSVWGTALYSQNLKGLKILEEFDFKMLPEERDFILIHYTKQGSLENIKKLIKEGASVNQESKDEKWSSAMWAVWNGNSQVAAFVMNSGGHLSLSQKNRLLERAVFNGDIVRADKFISLGGDVDYIADNTNALLTIAGLKKDIAMFDLLKSRGAKISKLKSTQEGKKASEIVIAQKLVEKYPRVAVFLPDSWEKGFIALAKEGKEIIKKENVTRPELKDDSNPLSFALAGAMLGAGIGGMPSETYTPGYSTYYEGGGGRQVMGHYTSHDASPSDVAKGMLAGLIIGGIIDFISSNEREKKREADEARFRAQVAEAERRHAEICAEIPLAEELFIDYGIDVNLQDSDDVPVLALAMKSNQIDFANMLLKNGADAENAFISLINSNDYKEARRLLPAIKRFSKEERGVLLEKVLFASDEILIDGIISRGGDAKALLRKLCKNKDYSKINFLISYISSVNDIPPDPVLGNSVLHDLAQIKSPHVELWIKKGADVNARNRFGETPLHIAVRNNDFYTVSALCNSGKCDVNIPFPNGEMPLHVAAEKENLKMVKALCSSGANKKAKDKDGRLPIQRFWNNPALFEILNTDSENILKKESL